MNFPYNVVFSRTATPSTSPTPATAGSPATTSPAPSPVWLAPFGGRCANHPQPCEDPPTDAGKFNHLRRVAIDPAGNIYGADFWGAGIEVFDPDRRLRSARSRAPSRRLPASPRPTAWTCAAAAASVYVMDRLNHRIQSFQPDGTYINKVGCPGHQAGTFSWPEGLTVGAGRHASGPSTPAATGSSSSRPTCPPTGRGAAGRRHRQPEPGRSSTTPRAPTSTPTAWCGSPTPATTGSRRYNPRDTRPSPPSAPRAPVAGQFHDPMGVAVTANAVYVADTGNDRVQKLSLTGVHQATFTTGLNEPEGIEVAPDGTVWVADTGNNRLVHLSANLADLGDGFGSSRRRATTSSSSPHDLAFGNDKMYVADTYNDRVQMFYECPARPSRRRPTSTPEYRDQISDPGGVAPIYPAGVEIVDGTWYVADSGGSRVVTINPSSGAVTPLTPTGSERPARPRGRRGRPDGPLGAQHRRQPGRARRTDRRPGAVDADPGQQPQPSPTASANDADPGLRGEHLRGHRREPVTAGSVKAFNRNGTAAWDADRPASARRSAGPATSASLDSGEVARRRHRQRPDRRARRRDRQLRAASSAPTAPTPASSSRRAASRPTARAACGSADALNYRVQHLSADGQPPGHPARPRPTGDGQRPVPVPALRHPDPGQRPTSRSATRSTSGSTVWDGAGSTPGVPGAHRRHEADQRRLQRRLRAWPTVPTARSTSPTGSTTGSRSSTPTATSSLAAGAATARRTAR